MTQSISEYNQNLNQNDNSICALLAQIIDTKYIGKIEGATAKIWHSHPVWFINENPIVGYSKQKNGIRLMFWSGADFDDERLNIVGAKFKDASISYNFANEIDLSALNEWLEKRIAIQWDY